MPGLHSANIASRLIDSVGAGKTIGPLLTGLKHSAQIVKVGASVSEIVTLALFAAYDSSKPNTFSSSDNNKLMSKKPRLLKTRYIILSVIFSLILFSSLLLFHLNFF